jgi:hypothetical protein
LNWTDPEIKVVVWAKTAQNQSSSLEKKKKSPISLSLFPLFKTGNMG